MRTLTLLFLVVVINGISAKPLRDDNLCGYVKCSVPKRFRYLEDNTYRYRYESDVVTSVDGTTTEESRLHLGATILLNFASNCHASLEVQDVTLEDSDPNDSESRNAVEKEEAFRAALQKEKLRFYFSEGSIPEVCPSADEPTWVLNFKRGVLSAFLNSMPRLDLDFSANEADVSGVCPTKYQLDSVRSSNVIIVKTKDLASCTERNHIQSPLQAVSYKFPGGFQHIPVINSTYHCEQEVGAFLFHRIECHESYMLTPFARGANGAVTKIHQKLLLEKVENYNHREDNELVHRRTNLLFEHDIEPFSENASKENVIDTWNELCEKTQGGIQMESSALYTQLVHQLRSLSYDDLLDFQEVSLPSCPQAKKYYFDALTALRTSAGVGLMKYHMKREDIPADLIDEWALSLTFISNPTGEMIQRVSEMFSLSQIRPQLTLAAGSLLHNYCKHLYSCEDDKHAVELIRVLTSQLESHCSGSTLDSTDRVNLLLILKSIGNAGFASKDLLQSLDVCMMNPDLGSEVRVATLDAYRRMPCGYRQQILWDVLSDDMEDSEIRIAAYLAIMRCPTYETVLQLKELLQYEEINQVRTFVMSHLKNLQETSLPSKAEIQGLVAGEEFSDKYKGDVRKFSRNLEASAFNDRTNLGGAAESNIIFSPDSYIPRSANLNVTVDIFGQSINLFEVGVRAEGWEESIESIFGPNGKLGNIPIQDVLKSLRLKRSAPSRRKLSQINRTFKAAERFHVDPQLSFSAKVFGNEIFFTHFEGLLQMKEKANEFNPISLWQYVFSGKELNYQKSAVFLDIRNSIPTCIGLPVHLDLEGTAVTQLTMRGQAKAGEVLLKGNFQMQANIRPSAAVDVSGKMQVDASVAHTGVKVRGRLHSSVAMEANVDVKGSKLVHVEFGLPETTTEIINMKSELTVVHGSKSHVVEGITNGRTDSSQCSGSLLERALGLRLCMEFSHANNSNVAAPSFPLNGPAAFHINIQKTDPSVRGFVFSFKQEANEDQHLASLILETKGSTIERQISARFTVNRKNNDYSFAVVLPGNKLEANGKYRYEPTDRHVDVAVNWNHQLMVAAQIGLKIGLDGESVVYSPVVSFSWAGRKAMELRGDVRQSSRKGITQYDGKLELQALSMFAKLTCNAQRGDKILAAKLDLEYKLGEGSRKETVNLDAKISNQSSKSMAQVLANVDFRSSAFPHRSFVGSWKYQRADGHMENAIELNFSPERNDDRYILRLRQLFSYYTSYEGVRFKFELEAVHPISNVSYLLSLKHYALGNSIQTSARFRYRPGKEFNTFFQLNRIPGPLVSVEGSWNFTAPGIHPVQLAASLQQQIDGQYEGFISGSWVTGESFKLEGSYRDRSNSSHLDHELNLLLTAAHVKPVRFMARLMKDEQVTDLITQTLYNEEKYNLRLKFNFPSREHFSWTAEWQKGTTMYSINFDLDLQQQVLLKIDIHVDKIRDIHFKFWLKAEQFHSRLLAEVKWDANRDPQQRVLLEVKFDQLKERQYRADFSLVIPGRTIKGLVSGSMTDMKIEGLLKVEWAPDKVVQVECLLGSVEDSFTTHGVFLKITTPFEGWLRTQLSAELTVEDGALLTVKIEWGNEQYISLIAKVDNLRVSVLDIAATVNITTTIVNWEEITMLFFFKNPKGSWDMGLDTQRKNAEQIILRTNGNYSVEQNFFEMASSVKIIFPVTSGTETGVEHIYTVQLNGPLMHLSNSVWSLKVTAPFEGYEKFSSKVVYKTKQGMHLFAELQIADERYYTDVVNVVNSWNDFNLQFILGTPLQSMELKSKLQDSVLDIAASFGENKTLGIFAAWRFVDQTDMWFGMSIQTPAEMLSDAGAELHIDLQNSYMINIGARFNEKKVGLHIDGSAFQEEPLKWHVHGKLDTLLYPTFSGSLSLWQEKNVIYTNVSMVPPFGEIFVANRFELHDLLNFNNRVDLGSPFDGFRALSFKVKIASNLEAEQYQLGFELGWSLDGNRWHECGVSLLLASPDEFVKQMSVEITTPFTLVEKLNASVGLLNETRYTFGLSLHTMGRVAAIQGVMQNEATMKDIQLTLESPFALWKTLKMEAGWNLQGQDNNVNGLLSFVKEETLEFSAHGNWRFVSNGLRVQGEARTPLPDLRYILLGLDYIYNPKTMSYELNAKATLPAAGSVSLNGVYSPGKGLFPDYTKAYQELQPYGATFDLGYNGIDVKITATLDLKAKLFHGSVTSPSTRVPRIVIHMEFPSTDSSIGTVSSIQWGDQRITFETKIESNAPGIFNISVKLTSPFEAFQEVYADLKIKNTLGTGKAEMNLELHTQYEPLEFLNVTTSYVIDTEEHHTVNYNFETPHWLGNGGCSWLHQTSENIWYSVNIEYWPVEDELYDDRDYEEEFGPIKEGFLTSMFFKNPGGLFSDVSSGIRFAMPNPQVDLGLNCTAKILPGDIQIQFKAAVPIPEPDVHVLQIDVTHEDSFSYFTNTLAYSTLLSQTKYSSYLEVALQRTDLKAKSRIEWSLREEDFVENFLNIQYAPQLILDYQLKTPLLQSQQFQLKGNYGVENENHIISLEVNYPTQIYAFSANVHYLFFPTMSGTVNITTPFSFLPQAGLHFKSNLNKKHYIGKYEFFWPDNEAVFEIDNTIDVGSRDFKLIRGVLRAQLPIESAKYTNIVYNYREKATLTNATMEVDFNTVRLLNVTYNSAISSSAGSDREQMKLEVGNHFWPLGVIYETEFQYSGGFEGSNLPTTNSYIGEIYDLQLRDTHWIKGEAHLKETYAGRGIHVIARTMNRTVELETKYGNINYKFEHDARFSWQKGMSVSYDVVVLNQTKNDEEEYTAELNVHFPRRSVLLTGLFRRQYPTSLSVEGDFAWNANRKDRTVGAEFHWTNLGTPYLLNYRMWAALRHPTLYDVIKGTAEYQSNRYDTHGAKFVLNYSDDPRRRLTAVAKTSWEAHHNLFQHWFNAHVEHDVTHLNMNMTHMILLDDSKINSENSIQYNRANETMGDAQLILLVDRLNTEATVEWITPGHTVVSEGKLLGEFPVYTIETVKRIDDNKPFKAQYSANLEGPYVRMNVDTDPDRFERFRLEGGVVDPRYILLKIWEEENTTHISNFDFHVRLNHTHLLTAKLLWRPDMPNEVISYTKQFLNNSYNNLVSTGHEWLLDAEDEGLLIIEALWEDMLDSLQPFLEDIHDITEIADDWEALLTYLDDMYFENEFFMRDIYSYAILTYEELEIKLEELYESFIEKLKEISGDTSQIIIRIIAGAIKEIQELYTLIRTFIANSDPSVVWDLIREVFHQLLDVYSKGVKWLQQRLTAAWEVLKQKAFVYLHDKQIAWGKHWKPRLLKIYGVLESAVLGVLQYITDFLYETTGDVFEYSNFYHKLNILVQDVDELYRDLTQNDAATNIRKYFTVVLRFLKEKYANLANLRIYMGDFGNFIEERWQRYASIPQVAEFASHIKAAYQKLIWLYNSLDVTSKIREAIVILYVNGRDLIYMNALEAADRHTHGRTNFVFEPSHGVLQWEQKLPFSWFALNRDPVYEELPEYRTINEIKQMFQPAESVPWSFWDTYYSILPYFDVENWLPPFKGEAIFVAPNLFYTFNGRLHRVGGTCSFIMAGDFVSNKFLIVVENKASGETSIPNIVVTVGKEVITIDLADKTVKDSKGTPLQLPTQMNTVALYQEINMLTLSSSLGFTVQCNMAYGVCRVTLSGWFFGKTGGLLGTMDHESLTDQWSPDREIETNVVRFAKSWEVGDDNLCTVDSGAKDVPEEILDSCTMLFENKISELQPCFSIVDPKPFLRSCQETAYYSERGVCSVAVAYMESCLSQGIPLRIPTSCVKCSIGDGKDQLQEGEFRQIEGRSSGRLSTDIVFIVEAKECNRQLKERRKMSDLIDGFTKELSELKVEMNRYATVVFGGDGVYNKPRAMVVQNSVFTSAQNAIKHFDNIPVGNGGNDIFEALLFAAKLPFRPGVSRTFILLPCTNCNPNSMNVDYSVVHQVLLEHDITLHILMNAEFSFDKDREAKTFFGMDGSTGYTKRDAKGRLQGDADLRRQVRLPKSTLGYCTPLALETNGTVFAGKKLDGKRNNLVKKFITVFAKRVASTASLSPCQNCECTSDNNGAAYLECYPCIYPRPAYIEYGFEEEVPSLINRPSRRGKAEEETEEDDD